ncbi:MAG: phospholipase D-like domain-containing protein [Planctomycetaceae bacterium]|jgi:ERCC4-related helicase|nr:phospholipase D-like domain-containing protein [Planctomycetaceae bacterium]
MLLDNKTQTQTQSEFDNNPFKVADFITQYTGQGELDIVTGFFSINAIALLFEKCKDIKNCRMILGKLTQQDYLSDKVIDLLAGNLSIDSSLKLSLSAQNAIKFLNQNNVEVKTVEHHFCHAKTYIYKDTIDNRNHFHIIGSSNLTDAGLGIYNSSNIELNTASTGDNNDFKELRQWFNYQWNNTAQNKIELPDKSKIEVKKYIIELIQKFFREYTPEELYYKILYEKFKKDFDKFANDAEFKREIAHLEETDIFRALYSYQQKGVLSLINMLQNHNGAILADAVGLGKTWTALAIMKYFEMKGYTVILLCPKRLRHNWEQYITGYGSKFENDEIDYYVRNHTDLQDNRLDSYFGREAFPLARIQRKQKILIVIDESHNLRNDKSSRYKFLVEKVLMPEKKNRDVKVLQLSATPINNGLIDVRNQFKLITKGSDDGFKETNFGINSLLTAFQQTQRKFTEWTKKPNRKISDFIGNLDDNVFKLTDALIVARTRKMIEGELGGMTFPKKEPPLNEFIAPKNIGNLKTFDDILNAININMTAYKPSSYILERKKGEKLAIEDEVNREKFLAKMMYILLIKRLESSWFAFKITVEKILKQHENALNKVNLFLEKKQDDNIEIKLDEDDKDDLQDSVNETSVDEDFVLGKKNPVEISQITSIKTFQKKLESDVNKLQKLKENLEIFERKFNENALATNDAKLERLVEIIVDKQKQKNKKVLIFTVYSDTAEFLYRELKKRNFQNLAFISGSRSETADGYSNKNFEPILERFAPYTKLYNEKDWTELYETTNSYKKDHKDEKWNIPYGKWSELIKDRDAETQKKLDNPIDILIATDCLSEGQNLQDCDFVINYDIHWNPVRLIQRMGRIDRIGSPNDTIKGVNFWPAKDYEDYLKLKSRVENRMAIMTVVGTEMDENLTPELQEMIKDNPLFSKQTEKMLEQMQLTWDDIETNDETLGLDNLSLEQFRQELFELFKKKEDFFKDIPNGVFTGFRLSNNLFQNWNYNENSLVAVLGYPRKPDENDKDYKYNEIYLLHTSYRDGVPNVSFLQNDMEILAFLRHHKLANRCVPKDIENCDKTVIANLSKAVNDWLQSQIPNVAADQLQNLFTGIIDPIIISTEPNKIEEKFKAENFDLINWFIISK